MARPRRVARKRKGRRRGGGNFHWWLLLALVLGLTAGGAYLYFQVRDENKVDAETLCPAATGPAGFVVLLLDLTDSLSPSQAGRLTQELDRQILEAETGTMFAVGVVSADPGNWGSQFALCKPLRGDQANELYQNPAFIEQRYSSGFREPLDAKLGEMLEADTEDFSPIMESLQALLAETPDFASLDRPKKIVIVSDLLQHSDVLSFYRGQYWQDFENSPNYARLSRNLAGADLHVLRLPRPGARISQPSAVDDFWVRYFDRQGVRSLDSTPLGDL